MTAYFAFKANEELADNIDTVLANLDNNVAEPQWPLYVKTSIEFTDAILQTILLDLVHAMGNHGGVLEQLASLLKGTVHVLVRQLLSKTPNAELKIASEYIHARRRHWNGHVYITIPITDSLRTRFDTVFEEVDSGNGEANVLVLRDAMSEFVDQAVVAYYDDFITKLKLGFIASKAASMARGTIVKGAHAAMNKMIPHLKQKELQAFSDYFGSHLVSEQEIERDPSVLDLQAV